MLPSAACVLPASQSIDRGGLSVSWGVPFVVAALAMVGAGVVIGFKTIKGTYGKSWAASVHSQLSICLQPFNGHLGSVQVEFICSSAQLAAAYSKYWVCKYTSWNGHLGPLGY
jgi:hypothetical protein